MSGVYILAKSHIGENKWLKGDEKKGEIHIFPQLVKSMHIFSPIAYWLTMYKIAQKKAEIFHLRRGKPHYNKFHLGRYQERMGGGKYMNFKFNIHPWTTSM